MKTIRLLFLPAACFALAWSAAHLVRTLAATGDPASFRRQVLTSPKAPVLPGIGLNRVNSLRDSFDHAPPGEWSALWQSFTDGADEPELKNLAQGNHSILRQLAQEELAVRTGQPAKGSSGAYAALADHDPEAAWELVRKTGQSAAASAVLRVLAIRDPQDALRRWREMPLRPAPRQMTVNEWYARGRAAVGHWPLGSLFASWARRDPMAAEAAVDSLPANLQSGVRNEIAMAWAYHDGPAALRYVSRHLDKKGTGAWRMDMVLLSALTNWPQETARILMEDPVLAASTTDWHSPWAVPGMWYLADPDNCLAWFRESGKTVSELLYSKAVLRDSAAAARVIREFPETAGEPARAIQTISGIADRDSAVGLALAEEFGIRAEVEGVLLNHAATRDWLDALRDHGPETAAAALGWTPQTATTISDFIHARLPEEAQELAALMPPGETPDPESTSPPSETKAAASPEPDPWAGNRKALFSTAPAAEALTLLQNGAPLQDWDAWNAVTLWAPHDPDAARAWLEQLPAGHARDLGQVAFAQSMSSRDPAGALKLLTSLPVEPDLDVLPIWSESLKRLVLNGGDWQSWLSRLPARTLRNEDPAKGEYLLKRDSKLEENLASEAALLAKLRADPAQ